MSDINGEDQSESMLDNRLGMCQVCGDCAAKYTCPRCETKTCCLECVNHHKSDLGCSGERNKTAFKKLSEFTNLDLLSDYRMLEETTRCVENYQRDSLKKYTQWNRSLPVRWSALRKAVLCRGAKLLFLPPHFLRHKSNTTYFNWETQKISWRVEWIFPQADFIKAVDERALEDTRICALLHKYMDHNTCPKELQDSLQWYQSAGISDLCLLLKAEHVKRSSAKFYEIDPSLSLKCAMKEKTIIEFPSIYVVHKAHKDMFEIVNSDDEQERKDLDEEQSKEKYWTNEKARGRYRNFHPRHQNSGRNSKRRKQKNFLFHESDSSDVSDDCSSSKQQRNVQKNNESNFNIPMYQELIQQNQ